VVDELRRFFGLEHRPVKVVESYQMLGEVDDELREILGIETESIDPPSGMFGFPNKDWKEWETPWGQVVLVPGLFIPRIADNGDVFLRPEGDPQAAEAAHMPSSSFFFDAIIRQDHFDEANLNPEDNLEEFGPISEEDLAYFTSEAERVRSRYRYVVANVGGTALGDIALIPGTFLKDPRGIRDVTEWYVSTVTRQDYIHAVFGRQVEIALNNLAKVYGIAGQFIDAIYLCGTDFGTQNATFCSEATFLELWAPHYRTLTGWIHDNTHWKVFKHSCGAVEPFINHFIDVGFDILNPVQVSAAGMNPELLKEKYGDLIVFWGGGIDTQQTLPFGSPAEVRVEVLERCRIFSESGGFVFNAVHNVQAKTPVANFVAMINAVREFNGEPQLAS